MFEKLVEKIHWYNFNDIGTPCFICLKSCYPHYLSLLLVGMIFCRMWFNVNEINDISWRWWQHSQTSQSLVFKVKMRRKRLWFDLWGLQKVKSSGNMSSSINAHIWGVKLDVRSVGGWTMLPVPDGTTWRKGAVVSSNHQRVDIYMIARWSQAH